MCEELRECRGGVDQGGGLASISLEPRSPKDNWG